MWISKGPLLVQSTALQIPPIKNELIVILQCVKGVRIFHVHIIPGSATLTLPPPLAHQIVFDRSEFWNLCGVQVRYSIETGAGDKD